MLRGPTLTNPVRRWGVIAAAGAIGFAIGIAGFARLGLDGIFRILNDLPAAAVGAGLSVTLALAGLAIAALKKTKPTSVGLPSQSHVPALSKSPPFR